MIRLEMSKKQEMILAALIVAAALVAFVLYTGMFSTPEPEPEPEPLPPTIQETVYAQIEGSNNTDEALRELLASGDYSLDNPLVAVDPYGTSPLTALVMFTTEEPSRITIRINGKTESASVMHTFDSFDTTHTIPVYGLYPGAANLVDIMAEPEEMPEGLMLPRTQLIIETADFDKYFSGTLITQAAQAADNFIDTSGPFAINLTESIDGKFIFTHVVPCAFDFNGDYRWHYQGHGTIYPTAYTESGNLLMILGTFDAGDALLVEVDLLGRIVGSLPVGQGFEYEGRGYNSVELRTLYS